MAASTSPLYFPPQWPQSHSSGKNRDKEIAYDFSTESIAAQAAAARRVLPSQVPGRVSATAVDTVTGRDWWRQARARAAGPAAQ